MKNGEIVVPLYYRNEINLAPVTPMAGHLGINKTYNKLPIILYWPEIWTDVPSSVKPITLAKCCTNQIRKYLLLLYILFLKNLSVGLLLIVGVLFLKQSQQ